MASINSVSIELQVKGEREATQALKRYSDASDKLTRSVLNAAGKVEATTNAWDRANKLFEKGILNTKGLQAAQTQLARELAVVNGYTKSNGTLNTQKALAELRAAQATREAAAAEATANAERQRAKQSYNQLLASINPAIAAQQRNARVAATVRDAVRSGAITRQQAIETIRQYKAAQDALNTTQSAAANKYVPQVKRQTNQLGVLMQQTGYQVGDFAVQVQSGTNVMVALGQQATQLVGTFGMLSKSTRMIGLFAGLGIVIPILTAIAGAFMRVNEESQDANDSLGSISSILRDIEDVQLARMGEGLVENARQARIEFARILDVIDEVSKRALDIQLRKPFEAVIAELESFQLRSSLIGQIGGGTPEFTAFGLKSREQAEFLATQLLRLEGDTKEELQSQLESITEALELRGLLTNEVQKMIVGLAEELSILDDSKEKTEETNTALQRQVTHQMQIATMQKEVNAGVEEILSYRDAELERLQAQTRINNLILEHGEDSRQVAEARAALERDAFIAKVKENEQLGNNLDILLEAYDAYIASKQAVEDTADAASDIGPALQSAIDQANAFANAIGRAADRSAGIGINTAGLRAEREALESGADLATARARGAAESLRQDLLKQLPPEPVQRSAGLSEIEEQVQSRFNEVLAREQEQERLSAERSARRSDTGGTGGGAVDEFASRVLSGELMEAIQRAQEETALYEKEVKMLDSALTNGLITQQEYNSYVLQAKEAYGQAAEGAREYENANLILANTMSDALGDALMSVVDGTKSASDAFSDMARIIIKKAFEMAVINPILNSIFGTGGLNISGYTNAPTLFANGAAFNQGNVIPFANGGVVGGPTTFPMANGQTGLMGEAGPEAIMPLKRGKDGKLGVTAEGGGNVVINQTFQFSANGDDSVKRIIAQEAPKIANLTQKQIMDQRRRGGAMKATFG